MVLKAVLTSMTLLCMQPLFSDVGHFYIKAGTGACVTQKANIHAPFPAWDRASEGYDGNLGCRGIFLAGVGYEFPCLFSTELTTSYRPSFRYRKFQRSSDTQSVGALGDKQREFDLDILNAMVNFYFSGKGVRGLSWNFGIFPVNLYPFIGFGLGCNQLTISNFRSTGIIPLEVNCGDNAPFLTETFSSDSPYTERFNFAYQLMLGLEARYCDSWALSVGYRWFDAGRFRGPRFIRDQCGTAIDLEDKSWRINVRANEFFLELKIYI